MVDQRRRPVKARQRGYGAPLAALIAGLAALVVFNLTRHQAAPSSPHASFRPTITASPHASPAGQAPAGRGATPPQPTAANTRTAAGPGSGGTPKPSPAPSLPGPTPSPTPSRPSSGLGVIAAVVVPLRGTTPVAVRAALVIGAAPPFPNVAQLPLVGDGVLGFALQ